MFVKLFETNNSRILKQKILMLLNVLYAIGMFSVLIMSILFNLFLYGFSSAFLDIITFMCASSVALLIPLDTYIIHHYINTTQYLKNSLNHN